MPYIGWDVSTSIIGVSFLDEEGKHGWSHHCDLRKVKPLFEKAMRAEKFVSDVLSAVDADACHHFVEDRLSSFSRGRTTQQTLLKLAAFNALVSWMIMKWVRPGSSAKHLHVATIAARMRRDGLVIPKGGDKKELTLAFVIDRLDAFPIDRNKNGKFQPWMYDRADSYCIARAGFLAR